MNLSVIWYLREFLSFEWVHKFLFVKTAPLTTPPYFRDYPLLTGKDCTHCFACMMICPVPGGIEVLMTREDACHLPVTQSPPPRCDTWNPVIYPGHCIRCGLCVEVCPEGVLMSGRVLESQFYDNTAFTSTFQLEVDHTLCMRCGNCSIACPVNKEVDPALGGGAPPSSMESIMLVTGGELKILNEDKCTGCKTCETACPNMAIRVVRQVEGIHQEEEEE